MTMTESPVKTSELSHVPVLDDQIGDLDSPDIESTPSCRICFLSNEEAPDLPPLIKPCLCKGTMAYVHTSCIAEWRKVSQRKNVGNGTFYES